MTIGSDILSIIKKIFLVSEELTRISAEVKELTRDNQNHEIRLTVIETTLSLSQAQLKADPARKLIELSMSSARTALLNLIATHSFRLGEFTLASGQKSDYYIDCRVTTLHAEGGRLAGIVLLDLIREHFPKARAVGGLTMGADPLVANTASASAWELADHREFEMLDPDEDHGPAPTLVHGFLVRKAEKTHGTGRRVEGFLEAGAEVVIVDDVCTTGGSTITAIEATRDAGMKVAGVLCLVDREQGGRLQIERALAEIPSDQEVPFLAVFTAKDVRRAHVDLRT